MIQQLITDLAKRYLTKERLAEIVSDLLDAAAQAIVDDTPDEVGNLTIDETIVLVKDKVLELIDEHLGDDDE